MCAGLLAVQAMMIYMSCGSTAIAQCSIQSALLLPVHLFACVPFLLQRHEINDSVFVVFENCGYPQWRSLTRKIQKDKSTTTQKNLHKWNAATRNYWEIWTIFSQFVNICLLVYRKCTTNRFCSKYSMHRKYLWSDLRPSLIQTWKQPIFLLNLFYDTYPVHHLLMWKRTTK